MSEVTNQAWNTAVIHEKLGGRRHRLNMKERCEHQRHADVHGRERNATSHSGQTIEEFGLLFASPASKPRDMHSFPA